MAKSAHKGGRKAEARYYFRAALDLDPSNTDALLWLAYLAGGGRPSLELLARALDIDPANQRARAAIRWARSSTGTQAPHPPYDRDVYRPRVVFGLAIFLLVLFGGMAIAAFVRDLPNINGHESAARAAVARDNRQPIVQPEDSPTAPAPAGEGTLAGSSPFPLPESTLTFVPTPSRPERTAVPSSTSPPTLTPTALPSPSITVVIEPTATPIEPTPAATARPTATRISLESIPTANVGEHFRWIDVDLSDQRLTAYEGERPVRDVLVSTGLPRTPTVKGRFKIYVKYPAATMSGDDYYLEGVPFVMYFHRGYGLHGTYWHTNFGHPMSHGCVNLPTPDAEWLYNWSSVGTLVVVHE
jgi:lipoprotein-anchoring transpeptidase ErfK/SrfK